MSGLLHFNSKGSGISKACGTLWGTAIESITRPHSGLNPSRFPGCKMRFSFQQERTAASASRPRNQVAHVRAGSLATCWQSDCHCL